MEAKQLSWQDSIEFLRAHKEPHHLHQLLPVVQGCLQILQRERTNLDSQNLESDLHEILNTCKLLDETAKEKIYRDRLGTLILEPLLKAAGDYKEFVASYLRSHLRFGRYGKNEYTLISEPSDSFFVLHNNKVQDIQGNSERYEEAALVTLLVEYWRELKVIDNERYFESDLGPLIDLCCHLVRRSLNSKSDVKRNELRRMVLLLQMIIEDHPDYNKIDWDEMALRDSLCPLLQDHKLELVKARAVFTLEEDVFEAQTWHTRLVISLLNNMLFAIVPMLGESPCDFAVCALGSTSRYDRRPYSDLELIVLHGKIKKTRNLQSPEKSSYLIDKYIYSILSLLDLMVVKLGETHDVQAGGDAGFHFDSSSHPIRKKLWGSPPMIFKRFIFAQSDNSCPWLSESFYSLLSPLFIHPGEFGGDGIIKEYKNLLSQYLDSNIVMNSQYTLSASTAKLPDEEMEFGKIYVHIQSNDDDDPTNFSICYRLRERSDRVFSGLIAASSLGVRDSSFINDQDEMQRLLPKILKITNNRNHTVVRYDTINYKECLEMLKLPQEINFDKLKYREGIAMCCLYDILRKSKEEYDKNKGLIDIKQAFYKPLVYSALNSGLFFGWDEIKPINIIQRVARNSSQDAYAIEKIWEAALSFIGIIQNWLHLDKQAQNEVLSYSLDSISAKQLWSQLELLYEGIIRPLFSQIEEGIKGGNFRFRHIFQAVLHTYLDYRHFWVENWSKRGLERDWLIDSSLIAVLAGYPDPTGWSPMMDKTLRKHIKELQQLRQTDKTSVRIEGIPSQGGVFYLPMKLQQECFDKNGNFKGDVEYSSKFSQVKAIEWEGKKWFIKVKKGNDKGLMGREYAAMILALLMGGDRPPIALGWPLQLTYQGYAFVRTYFAWISEAAEGPSVADVMLSNPEKLKAENIDIQIFTQLFFFTYLMCPEDAQPENFKLITLTNGKNAPINFDYGHCFVRSMREEKKGLWIFSKEVEVIMIKTMVYLLESMDSMLYRHYVSQILYLSIDSFYKQWKSSIERINASGQLSRTIMDVDEGVLLCIKTRLTLLQNCLRYVGQEATGNDVLRTLEFITWAQYQSLKPQIKTPDDFYKKIDVTAYVKDSNSGRYVSSTTFSAIQKQTITPELLQQNCDLEPHYFDKIDYHEFDDEAQKFNLRLLKKTASKKGAHFERLNLSGCRVIDSQQLLMSLEKMTNLESLDISECSLSDEVLFDLFEYRVRLKALKWGVLCPQLKKLYYTSNGQNKSLEIHLSLIQREVLTKFIREIFSRQEKSRQKLKDAVAYASDPNKVFNYLDRVARESQADSYGKDPKAAFVQNMTLRLFAFVVGHGADGVRWAATLSVDEATNRLLLDTVTLEKLLAYVKSLPESELKLMDGETDKQEIPLRFFGSSVRSNNNSNNDPIPDDSDFGWYSDEEISLLLSHYVEKEDVIILSCLQGTAWSGNNKLQDSLVQYSQTRIQAITDQTCMSSRILIPVNLSRQNWALVCMNFTREARKFSDIFYFDPQGNPINEEVLSILQHPSVSSGTEIIAAENVILHEYDYTSGTWIIEVARYFTKYGKLPRPDEIDIGAARMQHSMDLEEIFSNSRLCSNPN